MQAVTVDRDKYIGGSDIPIIMGISSFKTRFDLLLEKVGIKENDFAGNKYTEYGNVMEPKIRNFINENMEDKFEEGKYIENDIRCHTDGINKEFVLEIKTTSRIHQRLEDYKEYLVQLLFYMEYTKRNHGKLAIYHRPDDFNEEFDVNRLIQYDIRIEDFKELIEQINNSVEQFRIDLSKVKENPFITEEELLPTDLTELSNRVVLLEDQLKRMKETEKQVSMIKEKLKSVMQDKKIKKWETPNGTKITLIEDKPDETVIEKEVDEDLFKKENFELIKLYELKQAEYLVDKEKIKKGKKGYVKITLPKEEQ